MVTNFCLLFRFLHIRMLQWGMSFGSQHFRIDPNWRYDVILKQIYKIRIIIVSLVIWKWALKINLSSLSPQTKTTVKPITIRILPHHSRQIISNLHHKTHFDCFHRWNVPNGQILSRKSSAQNKTNWFSNRRHNTVSYQRPQHLGSAHLSYWLNRTIVLLHSNW